MGRVWHFGLGSHPAIFSAYTRRTTVRSFLASSDGRCLQ